MRWMSSGSGLFHATLKQIVENFKTLVEHLRWSRKTILGEIKFEVVVRLTLMELFLQIIQHRTEMLSTRMKVFTSLERASLTLNNEKSALISLLDGNDEFVAIDDIDTSSSSILRQKSSSFVAFTVLVVGGNTAEKKSNKNYWKVKLDHDGKILCNEK